MKICIFRKRIHSFFLAGKYWQSLPFGGAGSSHFHIFHQLEFPHFFSEKRKKNYLSKKWKNSVVLIFFLWMSVVLFLVSKKDDKLRIIKGRREFGVSAFVRVRDLRVRFARFEWIIREHMVRFLGNFRKILCCLIDLYNLTYF